jgi:hypothetical protein
MFVDHDESKPNARQNVTDEVRTNLKVFFTALDEDGNLVVSPSEAVTAQQTEAETLFIVELPEIPDVARYLTVTLHHGSNGQFTSLTRKDT